MNYILVAAIYLLTTLSCKTTKSTPHTSDQRDSAMLAENPNYTDFYQCAVEMYDFADPDYLDRKAASVYSNKDESKIGLLYFPLKFERNQNVIVTPRGSFELSRSKVEKILKASNGKPQWLIVKLTSHDSQLIDEVSLIAISKQTNEIIQPIQPSSNDEVTQFAMKSPAHYLEAPAASESVLKSIYVPLSVTYYALEDSLTRIYKAVESSSSQEVLSPREVFYQAFGSYPEDSEKFASYMLSTLDLALKSLNKASCHNFAGSSFTKEIENHQSKLQKVFRIETTFSLQEFVVSAFSDN